MSVNYTDINITSGKSDKRVTLTKYLLDKLDSNPHSLEGERTVKNIGTPFYPP